MSINIRPKKYTTQVDVRDNWFKKQGVTALAIASYCVLVTDTEKFIIRSSARFMSKCQSPKLKNDLKLCFGQEANHAIVNEQFTEQLTNQGFHTNLLLKANQFISFGLLESILSDRLKLCVSAALEQLNTCVAIQGLSQNWMKNTPSDVADFVNWHFIEEIEHRTVVFDLMKEMNIGRFSRMFCMALVLASFIGWTTLGAIWLAVQYPRGLLRTSSGSRFKIIRPMIASAIRFCRSKYNPENESLPRLYHDLRHTL